MQTEIMKGCRGDALRRTPRQSRVLESVFCWTDEGVRHKGLKYRDAVKASRCESKATGRRPALRANGGIRTHDH